MKISKVARKSADKRAKPLPAGVKSPDGPGLRERKLQATRERLARAAMALFLERGFEATTIDDIAAAADVSRRSFFHYFASKEDVVSAWQEGAAAALVAEVVGRPAGESMLTAAENAIAAALKRIDPAEAAAMSRLKRDNSRASGTRPAQIREARARPGRGAFTARQNQIGQAEGAARRHDRHRRDARRRRELDR
ncbi:AcrR family transcriptional regulator [Bradyrhizobium sp. LB7.1]